MLSRRELIAAVSAATSMRQKDVADVADAVFREISRALAAGDGYSFRRFGTFLPVRYKSHVGRNPRKPSETYVVPGGVSVKFRAGSNLRLALNGGSPENGE